MSKAIKYIIWFLVGQATQVILAILAKVSFMSRPIWFCVAGGFILTVAIIVGVRMNTEEKPKTYLEWAEGKET